MSAEESSKVSRLKRYRKASMIYANYMNRQDVADDFAQEACEQYIIRYPYRPKVEHAWVDFWRRRQGRSSAEDFKIRRRLEYTTEFNPLNHDRAEAALQLDMLSYMNLLSCMEPRGKRNKFTRAIVHLTFMWGFSMHEIAITFGVTEALVSQMLTAAIEKFNRVHKDVDPLTDTGEKGMNAKKNS